MIHIDVHGNACIREVRSNFDYLSSNADMRYEPSPDPRKSQKLGMSEKQKSSLRFEVSKMVSFKGEISLNKQQR